MDYYTNVISYGNSILIRGVKNGERITARNKYQPTLFVPVQKETQYKTLDGRSLTPVKQQSIKHAKEFLSQYENQQNLIYGMTRYNFQYISKIKFTVLFWLMS